MDAERRSGEQPDWLAIDDLPPDEAGPPRRSPVLYVAAALPWVVVAVLVVRPPSPAPGEDPVALPASAAATPSPAPTPPATAAPLDLSPGPDASSGTITRSGALIAVDEDEARAVAVVEARRFLTTVGPGAGDDGSAGAYAEHLVVEGVDHPAPGAAVVTVRALVLSVEGDAYRAVEVRRVAVPLRFDAAGAAVGGAPYLLPASDRGAEPIELGGAIEDPDLLLQAGEALAAAGYADIAVHTLHRTSSWPLVVTADVRAGDGTEPSRVAVWLRPHLGRLVVAGLRPPRQPARTSPEDLPSSPDAGATAGDHPDHEEVAP